VTSPIGGEIWQACSTHAITWTQTGLEEISIRLYKGGVFQSELGLSEASAGTFDWTIALDTGPGADYQIGIADYFGNGDFSEYFAIVRGARVDFNRDGQEDVLWRYYGPGGYNRAWFLGNNTGAGSLTMGTADQKMKAGAPGSTSAGKRSRKTGLNDPREIGLITKDPALRAEDLRKLMGGEDVVTVGDPRRAGDAAVPLPQLMGIADPRQVKLALDPKALSDTPAEITAAPILFGGADVLAVADLNWQIVGTGDFNNDTHVDILWRNISSGTNVVWFMNGTEWASSAELIPVADLTWQIVGTGDFNNDTHVDILWRNSSSGSNVVWYMDGTTWIGSVVLLGVSDTSWRIVGTGDFNKDGNVDVLWRYNGAGGYNVVWYLNNATWTGSAELISVGDLTWQIVGTGDYNNDGSVDLLWRFNGAGGYDVIWYMNGVIWSESAELLPVPDLNWKIVSR
jgi:hypothetical protein